MGFKVSMKNFTFFGFIFLSILFYGCSAVTGTYHYSEGTRCLEGKRYEDACSHLEKSVQLDPDYANGHNNLALAYRLAGEEKKAWPHMRKAWMLEPKNAYFAKNLENYWNFYKTSWGFQKGTHKDEIIQVLGEPDAVIQKDNGIGCLIYGSIVLYLEKDKLDREDCNILASKIK